MDPQTYEQEAVDVQLFGDQNDYFVEDLEATLSFHDGEAVAGSLAPWSCKCQNCHHCSAVATSACLPNHTGLCPCGYLMFTHSHDRLTLC